MSAKPPRRPRLVKPRPALASIAPPAAISPLERWFTARDWTPFPFQREAWSRYLAGHSGLVHAPTGFGKTMSVWGGPLLEWMCEIGDAPAAESTQNSSAGSNAKSPAAVARARRDAAPPLRVLWITPLRALAADTCDSLLDPVQNLGLPWTVELRTGDVSSAVRQRQKRRLPTTLVTTPESLSLLLSYPDSAEQFAHLRCVVVDEWHELLGTKRGVMTELCLARLRAICGARMRTWGLSATLANLDESLAVLAGARKMTPPPLLVQGAAPKALEVHVLRPESIERFPWAGHLGIRLLPDVLAAIDAARTTLLFTNTRSQCEQWFQTVLAERPDYAGRIALHHGSLDRAVREFVEDELRRGEMKCVVCTSSLDLGVDFSPVDQVIQVGSPKGIARLLQRAGRSGHQPGATSRILCVPTHALELVEFSAARNAIAQGDIEARAPLVAPMDLLAQHVLTLALTGIVTEDAAFREIQTTHAYRDVTRAQFERVLDFAATGGPALRLYDQFQKLLRVPRAAMTMATPALARTHRMSIGTISSDATMLVKFANGATLGGIEEAFIARLRPGDRFLFAGRTLELVRVRDMVATVRPAAGASRGQVPRWMGGRMPLSSQLARAVRQRLHLAQGGDYPDAEMQTVRPILELQRTRSHIPAEDELLVEILHFREGHAAYVFTLEGRLAHEGLASLVAWRLAQRAPQSVSMTVNDYGFELLGSGEIPTDESVWRAVLTPDNLALDLLECLNTSELARRQFRDVARVAGMIHTGYPGQRSKSTRQIQASSSLIFDVLRNHDPENLLLEQARREVLESQLEFARMEQALRRIDSSRLVIRPLTRLSPLAFPLWADRLSTQLTTEKHSDRIRRMLAQLESD